MIRSAGQLETLFTMALTEASSSSEHTINSTGPTSDLVEADEGDAASKGSASCGAIARAPTRVPE